VSPQDTWQSRLLAPRSVFTPARRLLHFVVARLPAPAQKLAVSALHKAAGRWPALTRLIGMVPGPTPSNGAPPAVAPDLVSDPVRRRDSILRLRGSGDFADRARAAAALAHMDDDEATAALVAALRDPSSEVGAQAAEALGHHRNEAALSALRGALENRDGFYSPETRSSAVRALGALLPENEGGVLASAVADVDATVSLSAIAALADRDEGASARALLGVLEDRAGFYLPLTRVAAARALLRLQHCDRDRVRGLLEAESDAKVREELQLIASR
jgi:hypothetical protein